MSGSGLPVRKRDRIRGIFGKSPAPLAPSAGGALLVNTIAGSGSTTLSSSTPQPTLPSPDFLADALSELTAEERSIVQEHVAHDIGETVQAAYRATKAQQAVCEAKRWSGSDKADKVLLWLDRFKSVGDVASNADPVHFGLPWAGIRMLLEVAIADSRQMAALAGGMNLALGIANRLRAYFAYFQRLPTASLTKQNLYKALVGLYAHILRFLAAALQIYHANPAARRFQAIWRQSELTTFERRGDELGQRADIEANNCDRELRATDLAAAARWKDDLDATLQKLDAIQFVQASIDALRVKVDLTKLSRVEEATYNSRTEAKLSKCLTGTRSEILHNITQWVENPDGKLIYWLCGKAGTGKSTISRTFAQTLDQQHCLGASFFFKRGEANRGNADLFFSTIAAQLADLIPHMRKHIAAALEEDSFICGKGLKQQFQKLLLGPLQSMNALHVPQQRVAIVIDALDECDRNTDIKEFISLCMQVEACSNLRIFMTSRPELPIQLGFRQADGSFHQDVLLEEVQEQTVRRDIGAYFDHEFAKIKEDRLLIRPDDALPADWPSQHDLQTLVELAVPLFIFASTVCRFVSEANPQKRLRLILEQRYKAGVSHLAMTYLPILQELLVGMEKDEQDRLLEDFREVVGPIVLAADPLSIASLASLLGIDHEDVNDRIKGLHSVLHIPTHRHDPIRLLHLSFRDFLVDSRRRKEGRFWIDESNTHRMLSRCCRRLLNESAISKSDIRGVAEPGFRRDELSAHQIATIIPPDIAYACSYWTWHLVHSGDELYDDGEVHHFLQQHFLHWLEALSWHGQLPSAVSYMSDMILNVQAIQSKVLEFLNDGKRFIIASRWGSVVRNTFIEQIPKLWACLPNMPKHWYGKKLDSVVGKVRFSPDGKVVVSASADKAVRLWDAQTGAQMQELDGVIDFIHDIVFSPDGQVVAALSDQSVQLWDTRTGKQTRRLEGHYSWAKGVVLPPNIQAVALVSAGSTARSWNLQTGEQTQRLTGHTSQAKVVTSSPDGQAVPSVSDDTTARLWVVQTGAQTPRLEEQTCFIEELSLSADGQIVASTSQNNTVPLWSVQTGEQIGLITGAKGDTRRISLCTSEEYLLTDMGTFVLASALQNAKENGPERTTSLELGHEWIRSHGKDLLFLPTRYRGCCSALHGETLAVGQSNGAVSFYRLA